MTVTRYSMGFALLAATACSPVADRVDGAGAVATVPYFASATPYGAPYGTPQPVYLPAGSLDPVPSYAIASTAPASAPVLATIPAPAPTYEAVGIASPATFLDRYAPTVAQARPAPRPQVVPARFRVEAPEERQAVASVGGRRFSVIDEVKVAELAARLDRPAPAPRQTPAPRARGLQVTTAEPFSIPTGTRGGKPYYLGSTPPAIEYHIPHIPQEEPLWCWAAAAQQAIGWVNNGRAPAQCAIVALAHGLNVQECCADRDGICARTGEIPAIAKLVQRFGGEARELASVPRDPQAVYDVLKGGDTLLIRIRPAPHDEAIGIRHMIVVRGVEWLRLPNNQLQATLLYNDPLGSGERAVNFDEIEPFFEQAMLLGRRG